MNAATVCPANRSPSGERFCRNRGRDHHRDLRWGRIELPRGRTVRFRRRSAFSLQPRLAGAAAFQSLLWRPHSAHSFQLPGLLHQQPQLDLHLSPSLFNRTKSARPHATLEAVQEDSMGYSCDEQVTATRFSCIFCSKETVSGCALRPGVTLTESGCLHSQAPSGGICDHPSLCPRLKMRSRVRSATTDPTKLETQRQTFHRIISGGCGAKPSRG